MDEKFINIKIENYFKSKDREMWKLGQKLCHQYRINYHFIVERLDDFTAMLVWGIDEKMKKNIIRYSLEHIDLPGGNFYDYQVYKIELCKS